MTQFSQKTSHSQPVSAAIALPSPPVALSVKIANLAAVIIPFAGLITAIISCWGWGINGLELSLLLIMYSLTVLGITIGYHRLFTHRAFETSKPLECFFAVLGAMAVQGPLFKWVAIHRQHHHYSDTEEDPHSPHHHGEGILGMLRGMWHAHIGWFFTPDSPDLLRYIKDLDRSNLLRRVSALFPLWVLLGLLVPAAIGGILLQSWAGAFGGLLWGGLVRIFLVHHVTWSINSVCHIWGSRTFESKDQSRNNLLFGILAFGEGWHNNHHAFPSSARHGLKWWQIDISYLIIRTLALFGLAWKLRSPGK